MSENHNRYQGNWQAALAYAWQEGYKKGFEAATEKASNKALADKQALLRLMKDFAIPEEELARVLAVPLDDLNC